MNDIVAAYLATWNAADLSDRDQLLAEHWAPDCTYVDPMMDVAGPGQVAAGIGAVHEQFPGYEFTLFGTADVQPRHLRFQWGLGPAGEEPVTIGFDVLTVDENQKIAAVYGFLDQLPGQEIREKEVPVREASAREATIPGYALGIISDVQFNEEIFEYMDAIELSLEKFGGRWLSHGRSPEVREGELHGDIVLIEFPDLATARDWYESEDYQVIIPLRTRNAGSIVAITEGVPSDYTTARTVEKLRRFVATR